jgi:hypothetical protein
MYFSRGIVPRALMGATLEMRKQSNPGPIACGSDYLMRQCFTAENAEIAEDYFLFGFLYS